MSPALAAGPLCNTWKRFGETTFSDRDPRTDATNYSVPRQFLKMKAFRFFRKSQTEEMLSQSQSHQAERVL